MTKHEDMKTSALPEQNQIRRIVVIASSVGGVDALMGLMKGFPARLPAPLLIVQHMADSKDSILPEILGRNTGIQVQSARDGMPVIPGIAYVAEPGKHIRIKDDHIRLSLGEKIRHVRPAADVLFGSVALEYGDRVIGVVLTGSGSDGTEGCRKIKKAGGITIAQNEETAAFFQMPGSAIRANCIDFVLPLSEIAAKIVELVSEEDR